MKKLISDVARLRRTCPWYEAQTLETTREYLIEETQEVLDALNDNPAAFRDELGDLLFEVLVFSEIASGLRWFSMQDVMDALHEKILRRNPHVFSDLKLDGIDAVNRNWQLVVFYIIKGAHLGEKLLSKRSPPHSVFSVR